MPPIRTPRRSEAPPGTGVIEPSTPNAPASYSPTPHNGLTLRHTQRYVGRVSGVQNFSQADLRALLEVLEQVVPYDVDSWDVVRERYNQYAASTARTERTAKALRDKFRGLLKDISFDSSDRSGNRKRAFNINRIIEEKERKERIDLEDGTRVHPLEGTSGVSEGEPMDTDEKKAAEVEEDNDDDDDDNDSDDDDEDDDDDVQEIPPPATATHPRGNPGRSGKAMPLTATPNTLVGKPTKAHSPRRRNLPTQQPSNLANQNSYIPPNTKPSEPQRTQSAPSGPVTAPTTSAQPPQQPPQHSLPPQHRFQPPPPLNKPQQQQGQQNQTPAGPRRLAPAPAPPPNYFLPPGYPNFPLAMPQQQPPPNFPQYQQALPPQQYATGPGQYPINQPGLVYPGAPAQGNPFQGPSSAPTAAVSQLQQPEHLSPPQNPLPPSDLPTALRDVLNNHLNTERTMHMLIQEQLKSESEEKLLWQRKCEEERRFWQMKCEEERTFWERRVGEEVRFWNDRYDGAMDEVQKLRERLLESEKRLGAVERERDLLLDGNVLEKLRVDSREQSREEEADGEQQEEEQEEEEEQEQGDFDVEMMDEDAGNITQEETRATATIRIRTRPSSSPDTETAKVTATAEMEPSQKIRTREASSDSTLPGSDADQDLENHGDVKRPAEELAEEEEVEENKHQKFNL